jgi:hypothetical protein
LLTACADSSLASHLPEEKSSVQTDTKGAVEAIGQIGTVIVQINDMPEHHCQRDGRAERPHQRNQPQSGGGGGSFVLMAFCSSDVRRRP